MTHEVIIPDGLQSFLVDLADLADGISMPHYDAQDFVVETKPDRTEVTVADRGVEQALMDAISTRFPTHQVLGEEFGVRGGDATSFYRWILDPIDGTSNFTRHVPVWATLIALEHHGELVGAMVSCPAMARRWWAIRGAGAYADGRPIRVSGITDVSNAFVSYSDGHWIDVAMRGRLGVLLASANRERCFGDFWQHMLVAEGSIDIAIEPIVSLWDLAAIQLIVQEAGGTFTDLQGHARADGGSAVSTNASLHQAVLDALRDPGGK
jgi:histidinol-phosphatase